jgi:hypothetical protein
MTPTQPPRIATLLLNRFAPNDPLAGDLDEEYRAGRSAVWYWRQVLTAVLVASLRGRDWHDLFAPQGMFMQVVMLGLVSVCVVFTVKVTAVVIFRDALMRVLSEPTLGLELVRIAVSFGISLLIGAIIARVHVRYPSAAVAAFSTSAMLWALANLYVLDGAGNLDSVLPHVVALLVFVCGLLTGGLHLDTAGRRTASR